MISFCGEVCALLAIRDIDKLQWKYLGLLLLLLGLSCQAVASDPEANANLWSSATLTGRFDDSPLRYELRGEIRLRSNTPMYQQTLLRAAFGYQAIDNHTSLWLGYDYRPVVMPDSGNIITIQSLWPEFRYADFLNPALHLIWYMRLEFRDRQDVTGTAVRLRQRTTLSFPKAINEYVTPEVSEELFFNMNHPTWVNPHTLEQNRVYAGLRFTLKKRTFLRVGYINVLLFRRSFNQMDHVLWLGLTFS